MYDCYAICMCCELNGCAICFVTLCYDSASKKLSEDDKYRHRVQCTINAFRFQYAIKEKHVSKFNCLVRNYSQPNYRTFISTLYVACGAWCSDAMIYVSLIPLLLYEWNITANVVETMQRHILRKNRNRIRAPNVATSPQSNHNNN